MCGSRPTRTAAVSAAVAEKRDEIEAELNKENLSPDDRMTGAVIDLFGQVKKRDDEPTAAHTLFNLLDRRHTRASTAVTSNIKLSAWGKYLGDATLAAAILDRLIMNAIRIDIDGPSFRQHVARQRSKVPDSPDIDPLDS